MAPKKMWFFAEQTARSVLQYTYYKLTSYEHLTFWYGFSTFGIQTTQLGPFVFGLMYHVEFCPNVVILGFHALEPDEGNFREPEQIIFWS